VYAVQAFAPENVAVDEDHRPVDSDEPHGTSHDTGFNSTGAMRWDSSRLQPAGPPPVMVTPGVDSFSVVLQQCGNVHLLLQVHAYYIGQSGGHVGDRLGRASDRSDAVGSLSASAMPRSRSRSRLSSLRFTPSSVRQAGDPFGCQVAEAGGETNSPMNWVTASQTFRRSCGDSECWIREPKAGAVRDTRTSRWEIEPHRVGEDDCIQDSMGRIVAASEDVADSMVEIPCLPS